MAFHDFSRMGKTKYVACMKDASYVSGSLQNFMQVVVEQKDE
jgi:hypothetical protein